MELQEYIGSISNKEDFIKFIEKLKYDNLFNYNEWENNDISSYLEGICSWVEDMDAYYENMKIKKPINIDWNFIAMLFYIGKIYE